MKKIVKKHLIGNQKCLVLINSILVLPQGTFFFCSMLYNTTTLFKVNALIYKLTEQKTFKCRCR